ncbi:MAG TPA: DUF3301 domain-containing protein [Methylophilaceae bacterium]|nr:DUF3301 domain-containing protein [Methylophilaceae bacterium]
MLLLAWFWFDSVTKREVAISVGRELATRCHLQLLDETVACVKIGIARNNDGHVLLTRLYEFEVSADGHSRLICNLQLFGKQLRDWHIPPYFQPIH